MSGPTSNNLTTQWSFRDGRDYVLSLTTTELPNTVSFWISDKITGEEWTGCYDENGIEVITKRTGCYKSFQTFLSMIKSALLKKSEAVILELLNLDDLNAISLHRHQQQQQNQQQQSSSGGGGRLIGADIVSPLNFQLYSSENNNGQPAHHNMPSSSMRQQSSLSPTRANKAPTAPDNDDNHPSSSSGMANNNRLAASLASSMNKRKYLIVTYITEFDKVHYPLPLNYSNPPDLNVMQQNILKLKAEVTSLQAAKKDLADKLESITASSASMPSSKGPSLLVRRGSKDKPEFSFRKRCSASRSKSPKKMGHVSFKTNNVEDTSSSSGSSPENNSDENENVNGRNRSNLLSMGDVAAQLEEDALLYTGDLNNDNANGEDEDGKDPSTGCKKCSGIITALKDKIRDLESTIDFQKTEHAHALEKLETENHFLLHKVEAAEKYEMELWNQLQKMKEKVAIADLDKENQMRNALDANKNGGASSGSAVLPSTSAQAKAKGVEKTSSTQARGSSSSRRNASSHSTQSHQSRHDVFYSSSRRKDGSSSSTKKALPASSSSIPNNYSNKSKYNNVGGGARRSSSLNSQRDGRARSNSTGSNTSSAGSVAGGRLRGSRSRPVSPMVPVMPPRQRTTSDSVASIRNRRNSVSPYHPSNYRSHSSGGAAARRSSISPAASSSHRRFDPTAYIAEKNKKLNEIANARSTKKDHVSRSRSRSNSRTRSVTPNHGAERGGHRCSSRRCGVLNGLNSNYPSTSSNLQPYPIRKSLITEDKLSKNHSHRDNNIGNGLTKLSVLKNHLDKRRSHFNRPRSMSADVDKRKGVLLSKNNNKNERDRITVLPALGADKNRQNSRPSSARGGFKSYQSNDKDDRFYRNKPLTALQAPQCVSDLNKRVLESAAELLAQSVAIVGSPRNGKRNSKGHGGNNGSSPIPLVILDEETARARRRSEQQNEENYDIALLQTKLTALQAFLETCVPHK